MTGNDFFPGIGLCCSLFTAAPGLRDLRQELCAVLALCPCQAPCSRSTTCVKIPAFITPVLWLQININRQAWKAVRYSFDVYLIQCWKGYVVELLFSEQHGRPLHESYLSQWCLAPPVSAAAAVRHPATELHRSRRLLAHCPVSSAQTCRQGCTYRRVVTGCSDIGRRQALLYDLLGRFQSSDLSGLCCRSHRWRHSRSPLGDLQ